MIVKLYIVTYKNHIGLQECLTSLRDTHLSTDTVLEINVINNHSEFVIGDKFKHINVLHNTLRPDFSTGHLSRSWNQGIIHGFKNLKNPASDIVALCQVDTIFKPDWLVRLIDLHKTYSFITAGWGDAFLSFTAHGVRRIGLFDERFCNIVHQETDYFMRAFLFNKEGSSINDFHHNRVLNPFLNGKDDDSFIYRKNSNTSITWRATVECHEYLTKFLLSKYVLNPLEWDLNNPPQLIKKLNLLYPYFEFDVIDFNQKYDYL